MNIKIMSGYSLIELLVAILITISIVTSLFIGWQRWYEVRALRETTWQLQAFLIRLRTQATWQNRNLPLWLIQGKPWCLGAGTKPSRECTKTNRQHFIAPWPNIKLIELRGEPGFYGRRDVAKAGSIFFGINSNTLRIIISSRGRIRLCSQKEELCE